MEPRPSRPNRPSSGSSRSHRAPWTPPEPTDELTTPRTADIYPQPAGSPSGGPWYGPHGSLGPEPPEYRAMKPPMPIKPRGERGNRWLRYLIAVVMLAVVVGGSAFAVTRFFGDDDDNPGTVGQTTAPETELPEVAATDPTPTEDAAGQSQPDGEAEPTATEEPVDEVAEPTEQTSEAQQAAPTEEVAVAAADTGEEEESSSERDAQSYLPAVEELDGEWTIQAEGVRTVEEVGLALGEGGEDALSGFQWSENQFRDFTREGQAADDETFFVSVSVHQFGNEEGAGEALDYFSDILVSGGVYQLAADASVGDASTALAGAQDGANLYALYVQDGDVMIRLGGSSLIGDPAPFVNDVAEFIVEN